MRRRRAGSAPAEKRRSRGALSDSFWKGRHVSANSNELSRHQRLRKATPTHKFCVGGLVLYRVGARSEKESYRITRLLPDSGAGLQYVIKGERGGLERVVTEEGMEFAR
jgi:hypothetical protein